MPREPTLQTLHIAYVAFNSILLGEIFIPDWDMFHVRIFASLLAYLSMLLTSVLANFLLFL